MALTDNEKMMLIAVLAVLMVLVLYFELRIMRGKAKEVRKVTVRKDEAYNAILTCRSVMNVLRREGLDVSEVRSLVDRAKFKMEHGQHEDAIALCEKAKEDMTRLRRVEARPEAPPPPHEYEPVEPSAPMVSRADSYAGTKLSGQAGTSYLIAEFEMNTARDVVAKAAAEGRNTAEASAHLRKAKSEFESGNYAKALSLAVKAKKAASPAAAEETIPLRVAQKPTSPMPEADGEAADVVDVCSSCGSGIQADDEFCGSCGAMRMRQRVCQKCGRVSAVKDRFCRKCGTEIA